MNFISIYPKLNQPSNGKIDTAHSLIFVCIYFTIKLFQNGERSWSIIMLACILYPFKDFELYFFFIFIVDTLLVKILLYFEKLERCILRSLEPWCRRRRSIILYQKLMYRTNCWRSRLLIFAVSKKIISCIFYFLYQLDKLELFFFSINQNFFFCTISQYLKYI